MMTPSLTLTVDPEHSRGERKTAAPIRVLHTRVVAGAGGGPDKTILRSASYFDRDRVWMSAAYLHPENDPGIDVIRATAARYGCPIHQVAERRAFDVPAVRQLLEICHDLDINVWHGHDYKTDVLGLILRRRHPMKLVTTVHGFTRETWRTRLYYHLDNAALLGYDHVIAVSPPLLEHCALRGVHPDRLSYVPNAIEPDEWTRTMSRAEAKAAHGVAADELVMGVVSRLSGEKGVDRAMRTLAILRAQFPNLKLHLIGDGPERETLGELAKRLGVLDAIKWYGWRADARRFYEMMDVLLLPSHTEGLPNVLLEAMAMGVPVAATSVGGVADLLDRGRCGVLLDSNLPNTWATRIAPILADTSAGDFQAQMARDRIERHFTFETRMRRIARVYHGVLGIAPEVSLPMRMRRAA